MTDGGFRHLVVLDGGRLEGIISMRDIVRAWRSQPSVASSAGHALPAA